MPVPYRATGLQGPVCRGIRYDRGSVHTSSCPTCDRYRTPVRPYRTSVRVEIAYHLIAGPAAQLRQGVAVCYMPDILARTTDKGPDALHGACTCRNRAPTTGMDCWSDIGRYGSRPLLLEGARRTPSLARWHRKVEERKPDNRFRSLCTGSSRGCSWALRSANCPFAGATIVHDLRLGARGFEIFPVLPEKAVHRRRTGLSDLESAKNGIRCRLTLSVI